MNPRLKKLLYDWDDDRTRQEMGADQLIKVFSEKTQQAVAVNTKEKALSSVETGSWICKYCKKRFRCGIALGGHIEAHIRALRLKNPTSCAENVDLSEFLSSNWNVRKRRGCKDEKLDNDPKDKIEVESDNETAEERSEIVQEDEIDNAEDSDDEDDSDISMIESLKFGLSDSSHQISKYHGGRTITQPDKAGDIAAEGSEGGGSMNQMDNACGSKMVEFDLNVSPKREDEE
ncbi:hypothetical protein O6P43_014647 [Quillaja saponaria]|uniref:C2H2-type domain-containing protein n=1 Tax=Quillaja saponaria TaxID=32244 RepID=A0AAD7PQX8_QUISA|nr:hypothetical protein O6P43_014647 [Quillaja saponaria]